MIINLEQYIKKPEETFEERMKELDGQLAELSCSGLGIEQLPRELLLKQKALCTYSRISPEFLRLHSEAEMEVNKWGKKRKISVPRFGVYSLNSPKMVIDMGYTRNGQVFRFIVKEPKLPGALIRELAISSEIFKDGRIGQLWSFGGDLGYEREREGFGSVDWSLPRKIRKQKKREAEDLGEHLLWGFDFNMIRIRSTLNCIVPTEARKKISEARQVFGDNIFAVAEVKPEDWNIERILSSDPLLIGVNGNDCFYIGEFNATPIEKYVSREYTGYECGETS